MASPLPFLVAVPAVTLTVALASSGCDVSPEASPFAFDDDLESDVAPPPTPEHEPDPDDEPDPVDEAPTTEPETPGLVAFVTSLEYTADLGGLQGADEICQYEAEAAELPGTFRAWISDATADAIDRIEGDGPWEAVTGERIFNNRAHLRTSPASPIATGPFGEAPFSTNVWTGTAVGGGFAGSGSCSGWTSEDPFGAAWAGLIDTGAEWTDFGPVPCEWEARLYCLQVG